jgi:hypothetical protein
MNYIQVSSSCYPSIMLTVTTSTARETRHVYIISDFNYPWLIYPFYAGEGTYATVYKVC